MVIDNSIFGIQKQSLADLQNISYKFPYNHPISLLDEIEQDSINVISKYLGANEGEVLGYITSGGTEGNLASLWYSKRYLINQSNDIIIKLQEKITNPLSTELAKLKAEKEIYFIKRPIVICSSHTHYSIKKICEVLSLDIIFVDVDELGEIDPNKFEMELVNQIKLFPLRGVIAVGTVGTTTHSGFDNIKIMNEILIKHTCNTEVNFTIHADAAFLGLLLPVIKPYGDNVKNYFKDLNVNTLSISGYKFLGISVCGITLVTSDIYKKAFNKEFCQGDLRLVDDTTISTSRKGINILQVHHAVYSIKLHEGTHLVQDMFDINMHNTQYFYDKLTKFFGNDQVVWNKKAFNILFPKLPQRYISKYCLMPAQMNKCSVSVLMNVDKNLIDKFLNEMKNDEEVLQSINKEMKINNPKF